MEKVLKHIILGAGGAIGNNLANELKSNGEQIKLVSRSGKRADGSESVKADLTNNDEANNVIEESSVVYLLVGLKYDYSVWKEQWFKIMSNTVEACKANNARLIFFDNVYSYGKVEGMMTEETPYNPCSKKGEIRAKLNEYLENEIKQKKINAIIARAADFYGPYSEKTSIPFLMVIQNLAKGKKAQWLVDSKTKHSFTYTEDCGKALYLLAQTKSAYNQVWHMPTANPPITGEEFIAFAARHLGEKPATTVLKKWMIKLAGLFTTEIKEIYEMLYQNEFDYVFDSTKFENQFNFKPISYEEGIKETIDFARKSRII